jgi:hypothetical protein
MADGAGEDKVATRIEVVIPYRPRVAFIAYHARDQRWAAMVCHRRAGKTVAASTS